ncbi:unnamed protein product [Dicrocoelium dendriticum]|nr:unnamed protein product [Dicrocoelium dendriticum]
MPHGSGTCVPRGPLPIREAIATRPIFAFTEPHRRRLQYHQGERQTSHTVRISRDAARRSS